MSNPEQEKNELMTASLDHAIEMGEALNRLQRNKDFVKVITDGYLRDKVLASFSLLAVPQIKSQGQRPDIMEDLVAASNLKYFFQIIEHEYEGARNPILSDEEEEELARLAIESESGQIEGGVN